MKEEIKEKIVYDEEYIDDDIDVEDDIEEDEVLPMTFYDIILLKDFEASHYGDIIQVTPGMYHTMIERKMGLPISCLDQINKEKNLIEEIKYLNEQVDRYEKICTKLEKELYELKYGNENED